VVRDLPARVCSLPLPGWTFDSATFTSLHLHFNNSRILDDISRNFLVNVPTLSEFLISEIREAAGRRPCSIARLNAFSAGDNSILLAVHDPGEPTEVHDGYVTRVKPVAFQVGCAGGRVWVAGVLARDDLAHACAVASVFPLVPTFWSLHQREAYSRHRAHKLICAAPTIHLQNDSSHHGHTGGDPTR
jgi:hypothetical protein